MAGSFCDHLEDRLLDTVLGNTAWVAIATISVALSTTTPTDAGGNVTEPTDASYARVAVTNNATNWPASSGGSKANGTAITFPTFTTASALVTHFVLYDDAGTPNPLAWGSLTNPKTIDIGDTASFAIGALTVTLS